MTMTRTRHFVLLGGALAAAASLPLLGCGDDDGGQAAESTAAEAKVNTVAPGDGGDYAPAIDPANFVDRIDNPYLPLLPGSRWVFEGESDGEIERIEVVVTDQRREVMGIPAVVVRDTVTVDGELIEDTYDWFAQDREGNVWYLGEETAEYEDGEVVTTEGSWEAGVDGALPGIIMLAHPAVGDSYRQEYYEGEAEDMGEVARLGDSATVPYGAFDDVLVINEWTPLEPDVSEEKYYAAGVGPILEVKTAGDEGEFELIEFTPGT